VSCHVGCDDAIFDSSDIDGFAALLLQTDQFVNELWVLIVCLLVARATGSPCCSVRQCPAVLTMLQIRRFRVQIPGGFPLNREGRPPAKESRQLSQLSSMMDTVGCCALKNDGRQLGAS
jgi:hypothetical protein